MSLIDLKTILQQQVDTNQAISVSEATLNSANLTPSSNFNTTIESYLNLTGPLSVTISGTIPDPTATQLTVTGKASFLGVTDVTTAVEFTLETNKEVNVLLVVTLPNTWKFATSFMFLVNYPFSELNLNQSHYLLTTAETRGYTWKSEQLVLYKGLNFASFLEMGGAFVILKKLISSLAPADKVLFTGTIDSTKISNPNTPTPLVSLTGSIDHPITSSFHFNLSLPQVLLTSDLDENGFIAYRTMFSTTLSVQNQPFSTFQAGILPNSDNLSLSMIPVDKPITPEDIVGLIGGVDYTKSIPPVFGTIFNSVGLTGLSASINTNAMEVIALGAGIGTTQPWQMGQFTIEGMTLNCQVLMPFDQTRKSVTVRFSALAHIFEHIFNGLFHFEITYTPASKDIVIAANFQGIVKLTDLITGLSNNTLQLPKNFDKIEFDDFGMTFVSSGNIYEYTLYGSARGTFDITILDSPIVATFEASVDSASKTYLLVGGLTIGDSFFQATANLGEKKVLSGTWSAQNDKYLGINDIVTAFQLPPLDVPPNLDLGLKSAGITYDITDETFIITAQSVNYGTAVFAIVTVDGKKECYFLLKIDHTFSLSKLPLVGQELAKVEEIGVGNLQIILGSAIPTQATINLINDLITAQFPTGYPLMPSNGLNRKFLLSAEINFGNQKIPISTGGAKEQAQLLKSLENGLPITEANASSNPVPPPTQAADGATWFNIQRSFGPVNFQKIGVKYENGALWFLINASLAVSGLEISVLGLSVGSPLNNFEPKFNIEGLGIEYSSPAVTISGAFDKISPKAPITLEFGGTVTIQLKEFGISAIGAYARFDEQTSMFIFASIEGPFGGPGFFFVTGFSGGFGYNSKLRIPGQDEVYQFPFVAALSDSNFFGNNPSPTDVLQKVMGGSAPWVTTSVDDIWISAGIMFTTYEVINSNALLIAEFGNKFLLALIGLSKARFPMEGPMVYAYVELQLEALFDPSDGIVSFTAVLSPNSYLLDKACHLTGGFALEFWYGSNPHAGDFVLTLGGYSPYFSPPDYYPQEPRLGFNWAIDSSISISGGVYFALTPAAVMAGGRLDATYHSGNLKAWFAAYTDIIIWYNPFHFVADIGISVGASYKVDLHFCSKTFTVELGANLTLWGPPTGGTATIHWWVISFTVDFGADPSDGLIKQSWSDFIKVLPAPDAAVKIVPLTGLSAGATMPNGSGSQAMTMAPDPSSKSWLVRADNFQFTSKATIPITKLYIEGIAEPVASGDSLNIKPMEETGLTSKSILSIISKETGKNELDSTWGIDYIKDNVPSALWGTGSNTKLPSGEHLITNQLSGFKITVPPPKLGSGSGDISIKNDLQYDPIPPGKNPLKLGLDPEGPIPKQSDDTILDIKDIMTTKVKDQRDDIFDTFELLRIDNISNGILNGLAKKAGALFTSEPLLIRDE